MTTLKTPTDIGSREDVESLVNHFYNKVRKDTLIGPIFDEVVKIDWETHLPKMYNFWETVLLGSNSFRGNPLGAHMALTAETEMSWPKFQRWLQLFNETLDDLFQGERTEHARRGAEDMANVIYSRINNVPDPRFDPANLTPEQRARYSRYKATNPE
ncbi:MAG: group III truncated hemoglobin [Chthoniobacterales bacterium]